MIPPLPLLRQLTSIPRVSCFRSCCIIVFILASFLGSALGEEAETTIFADFSCLEDSLQPNTSKTYRIHVDGCLPGIENEIGFLHLEIWSVQSDPPSGSLVSNRSIFVRVEPGAAAPVVQEFVISDNGTISCVIGQDESSATLTVPIGKGEDDLNWFATLSTGSIPSNFFFKAWCSDTEKCVQNCGVPADGLCVGSQTCRCVRDSKNSTCDPDVQFISSLGALDESLVGHFEEVVEPGDWKYFSFEVPDGYARFLVELSRSRGDVALFVKPGSSKDNVQVLPSEYDLNGFSDKLSYFRRLSHHHLNASGTGLFYIGVLNSKTCVQEPSSINLTVRAVPIFSSAFLCPFNCSYPFGVCIHDGSCLCEDDYGGAFCESSVQAIKPLRDVSGILQSGKSKYLRLQQSDLDGESNIYISFTRSGGQAILVAQRNDFPTPTDYYLKFSSTSTATASKLEEYEFDSSYLGGDDLILAIFNLDFGIHEATTFQMAVRIFPDRDVKGLSSWLILLVAIVSSMLVCVSVGVCKTMLRHRLRLSVTRNLVEASTLGSISDEGVVGRQGVDIKVMERFPLLIYKEGMLGKDETQCPICLNDYVAAEVLCAIPVCTHIFHVACIDKWLQANNNCPLCRISLQHMSPPVAVDFNRRSTYVIPEAHRLSPGDSSQLGEGFQTGVIQSEFSAFQMGPWKPVVTPADTASSSAAHNYRLEEAMAQGT